MTPSKRQQIHTGGSGLEKADSIRQTLRSS